MAIVSVLMLTCAEGATAGRWTLISEDGIAAMQQAYLERMAAPRNPHAASREEWEARRQVVRRHVMESLALDPEPERLPLEVHVSGQLDREGYVVKRLYWQTWPGYYASGYLYLPKGVSGKAPAVLNPHGHWENGCRNPVVQARLISLARKGYVCLTIDSVHAYDYYSGVTPLTVMTWSNIRGLDLLCSLPEVDADRIGCTGCSGGGQQTFYLMAVEDRIAAAAPVCMVSESRRILQAAWAHCPCNHVAGLLAETDATEMAACLAPKPSLYICVTGDWTKWFPQEGYPEISSVFALYEARDRVECFQHDWHHDYSQPMREQVYAWFNHWLKGIEDPEEAKEAPFEPESLETLASLDGPPEGARGPEAVFEERRARRTPHPLPPLRPGEGEGGKRLFRGSLREVFREPEELISPDPEVISREAAGGLTITRLTLRTEPEVRVPVVLLLPGGREGRLPGLVVADSRGKETLLTEDWASVAGLAKRGVCVAVADVRFFGEWALRADVQRLNGVFFGRSPAAIGSHDLLAVAAWLRSRPEVRSEAVGVLGLGDAGPLGLMAGAMEPDIRFVAAPEVGSTYAAGRDDPTACHLVTVGDLPEIAASCAPRSLWVSGATEEGRWEVARRAYAALGAEEAGRIGGAVAGVGEEGLVRWLVEAGSP